MTSLPQENKTTTKVFDLVAKQNKEILNVVEAYKGFLVYETVELSDWVPFTNDESVENFFLRDSGLAVT